MLEPCRLFTLRISTHNYRLRNIGKHTGTLKNGSAPLVEHGGTIYIVPFHTIMYLNIPEHSEICLDLYIFPYMYVDRPN